MNKFNIFIICQLAVGHSVELFTPSGNTKTFTTNPQVWQNNLRSRIHGKSRSRLDIAKRYVHELGFEPNQYVVKNNYHSDSLQVTHVYFRQLVDDLEVFNANININVDQNGKIISVGDSFYRAPSKGREAPQAPTFPQDISPATKAMNSLLKHLNMPVSHDIREKAMDFTGDGLVLENVPGAVKEPRAQLGWIQDKDKLIPVWDLKLDLYRDYYHAHVSLETQETVSLINWVHNATYKVFPFRLNDPSEDDRWLIKDPHNLQASPLGWHATSNETFTNTAGNNVIAVTVTAEDPLELDPSVRVEGKDLVFDFPFNATKSPETYKEAAVTNLFYINNMIHDLYYVYGFDEKAGNFQQDNFGKEGLGGDAVIAHAQDPSYMNNAFFSTPPDGEHGHMQMFIFDDTDPMRDGDFDAGIMIHEYTHGLSIRLTGGPADSDCLSYGESGGLGEGWGDMMATMIRTRTTDTRESNFGIGSYVTESKTIRHYMYSTNLETNPSTYDLLNTYNEVHNIGELWTAILYEVYWNLIDTIGFTNDWFRAAKKPDKYGNTYMLQLLIDAMKLQSCNPGFIEARDAIIQAEQIRTKGKFKCELWRGFAKRGLGLNATVEGVAPIQEYFESKEIPTDC